MKQMTILGRLNTAFAVLVTLLMAGGLLALWSEKTVTNAERRGVELANKTDRIYLDQALLSDALRGLLLDGKSDSDKKRRHDAEKDLAENLKFIENNFTNHLDLLNSIQNL